MVSMFTYFSGFMLSLPVRIIVLSCIQGCACTCMYSNICTYMCVHVTCSWPGWYYVSKSCGS